jgi:DNA invertase Pin-like site-specific DNA recombinase
MIAPNDARVYGYARRSSDGQILSLQAQKDRIHERADSLGMTVDHVFEETESAKEVAWNKRPVCIDLRNALRKGDTLIVWQIKRLDRNFWRQLDCARFFGEHGIRLIILDFNGIEFDLNTAMGRCIFTIMCSFADMEQESRIDAVKRGVSLLQQGELWFRTGKNKPRFGRRWEWVEVGEDFKTRRAGSTRRQREAWDEHECNLIREVWVRYHHLHQSRREIGRIFLKRKEKTPEGAPWVHMQTRHSKECQQARRGGRPKGGWGCWAEGCVRYPDFSRITEVVEWLDELIANDAVPHALKITPATIQALKDRITSSGGDSS